MGKKSPLTRRRFDEFFSLLPARADSERSWTVERAAIEAKNYDLEAVNPHAKPTEDMRTPEELRDLIEAKGREVSTAVAELRKLSSGPSAAMIETGAVVPGDDPSRSES